MAEESTSTPEGSEGAATAPETPETDRSEPETGLGEAGKKALQEERRKARTAEKQLGELQRKLQEFEDRDKTEAQKLAERATAAERNAADAQGRLLRYEVAAAKNLPPTLAVRLQGSTKDELEADADTLLEELGRQQRAATPSYDGGVRQSAPQTTDMNSLIRQAAGRG